jgi:four helix bundle protein
MVYDRVEDLRIYQIAEEMAEKVWKLVAAWPIFAKDTIGKQLVRSADSIGANIAEGYGRHHIKDNIWFLYIARGSLQETKSWLAKVRERKLIAIQDYEKLITLIRTLEPALNRFINAKANIGR